MTIRRGDDTEVTVKAKYVVGCDGAHSTVREAIGRKPQGAGEDKAWGVMDILAVTDFPDIRFKASIQSGSGGNILLAIGQRHRVHVADLQRVAHQRGYLAVGLAGAAHPLDRDLAVLSRRRPW